MDHYVGIDVSLEQSSVCVVDGTGQIVREVKVASEPEALIDFLAGLQLSLARVGLEAGPLSQWLHAGLTKACHDAVLLETRHVKAALSAMIVKTDRRDARGIAQLLRMGGASQRFRPAQPIGMAREGWFTTSRLRPKRCACCWSPASICKPRCAISS